MPTELPNSPTTSTRKAHTSLLEALVSVLLVFAILVVTAKCYQSLSRMNESTPAGSSIGTTGGGFTTIQKTER
jgi:hypothetical protein